MSEKRNVHEVGSERHGIRWMLANRRAVEILWTSKLRADSPEFKEALPLVLLKVLDGNMLDLGYKWNQETLKWEAPDGK